MERVWVVSVPHTGTHFVLRLLEAMGPWTHPPRHTHDVQAVGAGWVRAGRPVVVPIRPLELARISELNRFEEQKAHWHSPSYPKVRASDFRMVLSWAGLPNVLLFHVNGDDSQVEQLAAFVGRPVPPYSWDPVNATEDRTGLKARYLAGLPTPELEGCRTADVVEMLA